MREITFRRNAQNSSTTSQEYISCHDPNGDIDLAKRIILEEYSKYPTLIEKSELKSVNLVSDLKVKNNADIDKYVKVCAAPDPEAKWMYIDLDFLQQEDYFRQCVNHEIWHLYDYAMTGSYKPDDPEWEKLNPEGFQYGAGGWVSYHDEFNNDFHPSEGFITGYATLGIDEDKAELFMYYFTDYLRSKLEEVLKNDSVVRKKLDMIISKI